MWRSCSKEPEKVPYCGKKTTLGAVISIKHGFAFKGEHFSDSGAHVVLTPGNFFDEGGFKHKAQEKYYTGPIPNDYILQKGDLIVAMTEQAEGLLGSAAFVPQGGIYLHNQRLGRVDPLNPELVDKGFLYYLFNWAGIRQQIRATCSGAKVRHTSPSRIYESKINLPPLDTQKKIAVILSAYDDLIQNNERRIKILEDMAQNLYREWFVNFRFPDHAKVKMVDSPLGKIPQGWSVQAFTDVADVRSGGTPSKSKPEYWNGSIPFFTPKDCQGSFYIHDTEDHVTQIGVEHCNSSLYVPETVFITARGTVGKVSMPDVPMAMNQSCYALVGKGGVSQLYVFLLTLDAVSYLKRNTGGATFDTIVVDTFRRFQVLTPPLPLINAFTTTVQAQFEMIRNLLLRSRLLRLTRDQLLPKLISGEADVTKLDIAVQKDAT